MKNICTIEIEAPISKVFDFINDETKHKLWLEGLEETIREPGYDRKNPLGSKFKQKIREGKKIEVYDGEVTAYDRPKHLGARVYNKAFSVQVDYRLTKVKKIHAPRVHLRGHVPQPRIQDARRAVSVRSCERLSKSR